MNRLLCLTSAFFLWTNHGLAQEFDLFPVRTFSEHSHGVRKAVFAPDGRTFATGGTRGEVAIWDVASGQKVATTEGHYSSVNDLRYSQDGSRLVSASSDGHVIVWDAATGRAVRKVNTSENPSERITIHFALLSKDGNSVYFGGEGKKLKVASVAGNGTFTTVYTDRKDPIKCAALSPDGNELVFAAGQYLIVLDPSTNKVVREYNTGTCIIQSLSYSADGSELLTWCSNARVDMRDAKTFLLRTSFRSGSGERRFSNMAQTDNSRYIITTDHASRFQMWDLQEKRLVMDAGAEQGTMLDFDANGSPTMVISASLDRTVKLWRIGNKVVEEEPKKKKQPEPEPQAQVLILTQSETVDDFTPVEVRETPAEPTPIVPVVKPPVKEEPVNEPVRVELLKEQPEPEVEQPVAEALKAEVVLGDSLSELPVRVNGRRVNPIRNDHKLNLLGRNLKIQVWDAQVIDGDIVSIYINDQCIITEYSIVREPKVVNFDASGFKRVYLYLHAHNIGTIPPNTATMMISDGVQDIQVEMRSDLTGSSAMELNFSDP
jgi:WD40 repeat protein